MLKDQIVFVSFNDYAVPEFKETKGGEKWINYGSDNKYPDYLLKLYNGSPKHNAILSAKAGYIAGKGFDGIGNEVANSYGETFTDLLIKQAIDLEIHGGFYLQRIFSKSGGKVEFYHVDYHKIRSNKNNTQFYYVEDGWSTYTQRDKVKTYPAFDVNRKSGSDILYFKDYRPGLNTYTLPSYIGCLSYIESDMFVADHVLNNSKYGFTPSKMIYFPDGEPGTEEEKKEIEKKIKEKYTGAKGTKFLVAFGVGADKKPLIEDLGQSDLTKENFEHVDRLIQQNIFSGHQISSPMLFGVKTEGQLGGRTEMMEAWELFKNTYVNGKQQKIERVWKVLLNKDVKIVHSAPIGYDLINNAKIFDLLPTSFVYETIGIDPKDYPELEEEQAKKAEEKAAQKQQFSEEDVLGFFAEVGSPRSEFEIIKTKKTVFSDDGVVEDLAFADINQQQANIIDLIRKDKRITPEALAEALKVPVPYVEQLLEDLTNKGLLKSTTEKKGSDKQIIREITSEVPKITEEVKPVTTEIFIKYSYEGPQDSRNRAFCARLLELDRLYSRSEIEKISERLGYSVWERRGGFWNQDGVVHPYCRHKWQQNIVIKKRG
jgi:DNA-binding MarR family transcriptional regulator